MKSSTMQQCIAAKALIKNKKGEVLVLRQSFEEAVQGAGMYHPPGGIVELGETLEQAVKREVLEETRLRVEVGNVVGVAQWQANIRGTMCYFVGVFYECRVAPGQTMNVDNDEAVGFAWVNRETINDVTVLEPSRAMIVKLLEGGN